MNYFEDNHRAQKYRTKIKEQRSKNKDRSMIFGYGWIKAGC